MAARATCSRQLPQLSAAQAACITGAGSSITAAAPQTVPVITNGRRAEAARGSCYCKQLQQRTLSLYTACVGVDARPRNLVEAYVVGVGPARATGWRQLTQRCGGSSSMRHSCCAAGDACDRSRAHLCWCWRSPRNLPRAAAAALWRLHAARLLRCRGCL
jgi:hypothetical protein